MLLLIEEIWYLTINIHREELHTRFHLSLTTWFVLRMVVTISLTLPPLGKEEN